MEVAVNANYLEIVKLNELSFSQRKISDIIGSGRHVIKRTIDTTKQHKLTYKELSGWAADQIDTFFGPEPSTFSQREMHYTMPNYATLTKSLAQPRVTIQLLWEEYVGVCLHNHQPYYRLTQFKKYFNDNLSKKSFTHAMKRKAGEHVEVDWVHILVRYDMRQSSRIDGHIQMFGYSRGTDR